MIADPQDAFPDICSLWWSNGFHALWSY